MHSRHGPNKICTASGEQKHQLTMNQNIRLRVGKIIVAITIIINKNC